ncbi:MAG TPA: hypothetical protein VK171_06620, partial [Fimbriimonas sp.]|nr:hypothetical protein [Fimbriimonas sp.]
MIRKATRDDCREIGEFLVDIRYDTVPMVHDEAEVAWYVEHILIARGSAYVYEVAGEVVAL